MPTAADLIAKLELIAKMMDVLGEDPFRASAHSRAARTLGDFPGDLGQLAADRGALLAIEGIGPKMADKIQEYFATGEMAEFTELRSRVPDGLLDLFEVPGLGPKTIRTLWLEGGVTDKASLKRIIDDGSILKLPRMGAKSVEKLKSSIAFTETAAQRLSLGLVLPLAEAIVKRLGAAPGVGKVSFAGSLRRGKETIGDIDLLACGKSHGAVAEAFCSMPGVTEVLAKGENKCSVRMTIDQHTARWKKKDEDPSAAGFQVDLRIVDASHWGAALLYFTGSKEHNVAIRERALRMGMTLNEYGLFPEDKTTKEPPQSRGIKPVAAATEQDIYKALHMPYVAPEIREDRGEIDLQKAPDLIELGDVKAELHAHTTASDGRLSIVELAEEAKRRGFHTIAVTDHSRSSAIANGLSPERLREHIKAVHAARREVHGIHILAGSEVDILQDGSLDYDDELLAELDIVVASPHVALSQEPAVATARLLKAIRHPLVHILGHPCGRLINRRAGLSPDIGELAAAAKEHGVALEINAHWMRLDLRDIHVRAVVEAGCNVAINCDVHEREDYDNLRYGVLTARRGWVAPGSCVNTWSRERLDAWRLGKRKR